MQTELALTVGSTPVSVKLSAPIVVCNGGNVSADAIPEGEHPQEYWHAVLNEKIGIIEMYQQQFGEMNRVLYAYRNLKDYMSRLSGTNGPVTAADWSTELFGLEGILGRINDDFARELSSSRIPSRRLRKRRSSASSREEDQPVSSSAERRMKTEESTTTL